MNKVEKFWDRIASNYEKEPIKDKQSFENTIENIKKHLKASDIVLDYACGTGTISNKIADSVTAIHAIDISSKMVEIAIEKAAALNLQNVHHSKATLFDDKLELEQYDAVLAFNVLHLSEDLRADIQRINQLLKPGGLFISSTPCLGKRRSLLSIVDFLVNRLGIVPNLNMPTFTELESEIQNSRFQIIEIQKPRLKSINYFLVAKKQ